MAADKTSPVLAGNPVAILTPYLVTKYIITKYAIRGIPDNKPISDRFKRGQRA
jgi:hypothetical protein